MNQLSKRSQLLIFSIILYVIAFVIFFFIIHNNIITDIQEHAEMLIVKINSGSFLTPPLYHFLVYLFSGFSTSPDTLKYTAVFILSFAVSLKFYGSYEVLKNISIEHRAATLQILLSLLFCASILFLVPIFFPVVDKRMLLGRIGLTIWHNSTVIFVLPFAIMLFTQSILFLQNKVIDYKQVIILGILAIINILIKPSFIFVFLPSFFLMSLFYYQTTKKLYLSILIMTVIALCLFLEYYIIYIIDSHGVVSGKKSGIGFGFFEVWSKYSNNILREVAISIAFPVLLIGMYYQKIKHNIYFQYAVLTFVFGFLIAAFVNETGDRIYHGNFFWQLIIANYLLFLVTASFLFKEIQAHTIKQLFQNKKLLLVVMCYLAHLSSGFLYLFRIFYAESYT